jgi:hypothetical protein
MVMNEAIKQGGVPEGYAEVVVEFFQFKDEGDNIAGRLVGKTTTQIRGNRIGKYTVMKDGKRFAFLGGVHLDELMSNIGIGNEIWVQYTHKEKTSGEGFELKKFKVFSKVAQ